MASLTITVPDAVVSRILTAMGHLDPTTQQWVDATQADVTAAIKQLVKAQVINYETTQQAMATRTSVSKEVW